MHTDVFRSKDIVLVTYLKQKTKSSENKTNKMCVLKEKEGYSQSGKC